MRAPTSPDFLQNYEASHRNDIDGIRTLAVLGVLIFHLDADWLPGGYLGVDVFFVISGYLITRNILRDVTGGRWRFLTFYSRRVLRLFPALFVTVILSLVAGFFIFTPPLLIELGKSAQASVFWYSNIYFWLQSGYFDTDSQFKPLLHTWSLSVEEQFYLFWPAMIVAVVALLGIRWLLPVLIIACIASWVASAVLDAGYPDMTFYLTPFRIFEFAMGACVLWGRRRAPPGKAVVELALALALVAVLAGYAVFEGGAYPASLSGLVVSLGAAVLLLFGDRSLLIGPFIGNPVHQWLGRISYSIYLVHWPLIAFAGFVLIRDLTLAEKVGLGVASILLGHLLHIAVERPFLALRATHGVWTNRFGIPAGIAAGAVLFLVAWFPVSQNGWPWRYPDNVRGAAVFDVKRERRATWREAEKFDWSSYDDAPFDVLVVGDSHGKDFFNAIVLNKVRVEERFGPLDVRAYITNRECRERSRKAINQCRSQYSGIFEIGLHKKAKVIVFSQSWAKAEIEQIPGVINRIRQEGTARVVVTDNTVVFHDIPSLLLRRYWNGDPSEWVRDHRDNNYELRNAELTKVLHGIDVPFIRKSKYVCSAKNCTVADETGKPYLYDRHHWTIDGARRVGRRMFEAGEFDVLLSRDEVPSKKKRRSRRAD